MATVSGVCRHPTTLVPGAYQVFAHDYFTGALLGSAISDATTGAYSIDVPAGSRVRVVRVNAPLVSVGSSLVLGMPMDGSGGVFDEIVGDHGLTAFFVEQAAVAGSPAGSAAVFDSNNDWLQLGSDPRLVFTGEFEAGFWVLHDSATSGEYFFWGGVNQGGIAFSSSGEVTWFGIDGNSGSLGVYTVGEWSHIVMSRDSAGTVRGFRDGVVVSQVDESNPGTIGNASGDASLGIGRWPGATSTTFRGKMSGFYMANAALHTADFTPGVVIPDASIYQVDAPFAAGEVIDNVLIPIGE